MNSETERQEVLFLWTADSSLLSRVIGWAFHSGNDVSRDLADAPYERGVDALADGWRLIQSATLHNRTGDVHVAGVLEFEWLFERVVKRVPDS